VATWEHELAGARSQINDRTRRVARPGFISPARVARQSMALTAAQVGWMVRRLPGDLAAGRPVSQPGEWLQDSAGYLLRDQLANLGPAAAELAQIIVDSEGIVPEFVVSELRRRPLPDIVVPTDMAERIAVQALPGRLGPVGPVVSVTPTSQLHQAELLDGTPVLLRVRRPGVDRAVRQDARIAASVLTPFEQLVPIFRAVRPLGLVELISRQLAEASDLRNEALNAIELGLVVERLGLDGLVVCRPLPGLVAERAAVFEAPGGGFPLHTIAAAPEKPADTRPLARLTVESALAAGVFAADLRLEQIVARPDGRLGVIGCGAVGRLDLTTRRALLDLLPALLTGDTAGQVAALRDLGIAPEGAAGDTLVSELAALQPANPLGLLSGQGGGVGALGREAVSVLVRRGVTPPLELVQLGRAGLALRAIFRRTNAPGGLLAALFPLLGRTSELRAQLD
jgi:ubiquinone biosynthesis protein